MRMCATSREPQNCWFLSFPSLGKNFIHKFIHIVQEASYIEKHTHTKIMYGILDKDFRIE